MTIDSAYYIENYNEHDEVPYVFVFEVMGTDALQVYRVTAGVPVLLVIDVDYTVVLNNYKLPISKGGTITLTTPLTDGEELSVRRKTPITNDQDFDLTGLGYLGFLTEGWEFAIDKLTMILQEIDGTICDCSAKKGYVVSSIESKYVSGGTFFGYHDSFGMVCTNDDGSIVMFNDHGYGEGLYTTDDFASTNPTRVTGNTISYPINSMHYDSSTAMFWQLVYSSSPRYSYFGRVSEADMAAETAYWLIQVPDASGHEGVYCHGFTPIGNELFWFGRGGSQSDTNKYEDTDIGWTTEKIASSPGLGISTAGYAVLDIGLGQVMYCIAKEGGASPFDIRVWDRALDNITYTTNIATNIFRVATDGAGQVLIFHSLLDDTFKVEHYVHGVSPDDTLLPTIDIVFPEYIELADFCYSAEHDAFFVIARDKLDPFKMYMQHALASSPTNWIDDGEFILEDRNGNSMGSSSNSQLYHSHDNTFYYAYMTRTTDVSTSNYLALAELTIT